MRRANRALAIKAANQTLTNQLNAEEEAAKRELTKDVQAATAVAE